MLKQLEAAMPYLKAAKAVFSLNHYSCVAVENAGGVRFKYADTFYPSGQSHEYGFTYWWNHPTGDGASSGRAFKSAEVQASRVFALLLMYEMEANP